MTGKRRPEPTRKTAVPRDPRSDPRAILIGDDERPDCPAEFTRRFDTAEGLIAHTLSALSRCGKKVRCAGTCGGGAASGGTRRVLS